ncbi:MAG: hypothetical protein FJ245_13160 [Nitrospira sp.]|nr:hypothetical protein [Nitrospira sp.]
MTRPPDEKARERAATATGCNIVVTAGAGTGKTTLLVDRLVALVLREPQPVAIGQIVALTFTNKAASEMKIRLRERLDRLRTLDPSREPDTESDRRVWEQLLALMARQGLTKVRVDELAGAALQELEKSQIGTIHSFAAHLLRLHPIESGVDPAFVEDDGTHFREHFVREWERWLDEQLGPKGQDHETWRTVLRAVTLDEAGALAEQLAGELTPVDRAAAASSEAGLSPAIAAWLETLGREARALRAGRDKTTLIERMLDAAAARFERVGAALPAAEDQELDRKLPGKTTAWSQENYARAKDVLRIAQALRTVEAEPVKLVVRLLLPFAARCRERFVARGFVSFDGLLARARDLLRDHPAIRRELKARFRAVLVDEFQDTDPVQYEMILYLAEAAGREAQEWRSLELEPGKLFIVGDPKQSIYAFRRADMEAYDHVVEDRILGRAPAGERHSLQANFRTHAGLLHVVNACFAGLFPAEAIKGIQPKHEALMPMDGQAPLPDERVEIRLVRPSGEEQDAETATRVEAEELARWLAEEVLGRQELREKGVATAIRPRHIAILLRKLTAARDYVEALRRYGISYVTEGEKHFYERQEVVDFVNLLRAVSDPYDRVALVGLLRSPLGGLTDREIADLAGQGLLDYRRTLPGLQQAGRFYERLRAWHETLPRCAAVEAVDRLMAETPVRELAAASLDGEQALANLHKLRGLVETLAQGPEMTLRRTARALSDRVLHPPDEAESPLAEEGDDDGEGAVRVLSIHKAKGLEYPMVVLAGLHQGSARRQAETFVLHDWASGVVGLRVGGQQTIGGLYAGAKLAWRQQAELRRVLYVGMTRAKRRLVLSAGLPASASRSADSFLGLLSGALGGLAMEDGASGERVVDLAGTAIPLRVCEGREAPMTTSGRESAWADDPGEYAAERARWTARDAACRSAKERTLFLSPTRLLAEASSREEAVRPAVRSGTSREQDIARLVGIAAHRVLETWDFHAEPVRLRACIEEACQAVAAQQTGPSAETLTEEVASLMGHFVRSPAYADLRRAEILGREVPFAIPWNGSGHQPCVMHGSIDLLYRLDGEVWIADYKTDRVGPDEVRARAETYRDQAQVYREAVAASLSIRSVRFQFVFMRCGVGVTL